MRRQSLPITNVPAHPKSKVAVRNPLQPKLVKRFEPSLPINPHTVLVVGNTLYVADYASPPSGIRIFGIADKHNPRSLGKISDPVWSIHDAANKTTVMIRLQRFGTAVEQPQDVPGQFALLANYPIRLLQRKSRFDCLNVNCSSSTFSMCPASACGRC